MIRFWPDLDTETSSHSSGPFTPDSLSAACVPQPFDSTTSPPVTPSAPTPSMGLPSA